MWINVEGTSQLVDAVSFLFVVPELLGESQLKMLHDLIIGAAKNLGSRLLNLGRGLLPDNILRLLLVVWRASKVSNFFDALSRAVRGYLRTVVAEQLPEHAGPRGSGNNTPGAGGEGSELFVVRFRLIGRQAQRRSGRQI